MPVDQIEFVNLQTARALGIEVPSGLLSIADERIGHFAAMHFVRQWPSSDLAECPLFGRHREKSGSDADIAQRLILTQTGH